MTLSAGYSAGTTVTLQPKEASRRNMLFLHPKSKATICIVQKGKNTVYIGSKVNRNTLHFRKSKMH